MYRINRFAVYAALFLLLTIEEVALHHFNMKGILPDTLMIFVIFFGLFSGIRLGIEAGLVCGFIKDVLGVGVFGLNILVFGLIGLICGALTDKVYKEHIVTQFAIVFMVSLIVSGLHLWHALYTALVAPLVFLLMQKLFKGSEMLEGWRY